MKAYFKNKVALVTGAASGLGKALSEQLAVLGAFVFITDKNSQNLQNHVVELQQKGYQADGIFLDVRSTDLWKTSLHSIIKSKQRLNLLINNAGINCIGEMQDFHIQDWQHIIDTNLMGVVHGCHYGYKLMLSQGFGHIVNIASLAGYIGYPTTIPYSTVKSGVITLSNTLRAEAKQHGIHVSVVLSGLVDTPIFDNQRIYGVHPEAYKSMHSAKLLSPSKAAKSILRGIMSIKPVIIYPFTSRIGYGLVRFIPGVAELIRGQGIKKFRKLREDV